MMARCRELLAQGSPVLFFPEGTRSADGKLQAFRDGAFRLAKAAGVPVIPVALSGTHETLPKHGFVLRHHMSAVVQVLEPIDPARYADRGRPARRGPRRHRPRPGGAMSAAAAFYEPLGDGRYRATPATIGPWSPGLQHAGPPCALLAHVLERLSPRPGARIARLSVELLGPGRGGGDAGRPPRWSARASASSSSRRAPR